MAKTDPQRLHDLKTALKVAKPAAMLTLNECAAIWGVSKPRFVNKRNDFAVFPDPVVDGNSHLFPARAALKAMISHLEGRQQAATQRARRQAALIGGTAAEEQLLHHTPAELIQLNRLAADVANREIQQGLYIPRADVEQTAGAVFSMLSEFMSGLSNRLDPHGKLPPEVRVLIDMHGNQQLLELHSRLKGLLSDDAVLTGIGKPAGKPKPARARRQR